METMQCLHYGCDEQIDQQTRFCDKHNIGDRILTDSMAQWQQMINEEHQHQYTIPVEWAYEHSYQGDDGYAVKTKHVTKMRCKCGDEVDR